MSRPGMPRHRDEAPSAEDRGGASCVSGPTPLMGVMVPHWYGDGERLRDQHRRRRLAPGRDADRPAVHRSNSRRLSRRSSGGMTECSVRAGVGLHRVFRPPGCKCPLPPDPAQKRTVWYLQSLQVSASWVKIPSGPQPTQSRLSLSSQRPRLSRKRWCFEHLSVARRGLLLHVAGTGCSTEILLRSGSRPTAAVQPARPALGRRRLGRTRVPRGGHSPTYATGCCGS